MTWSNDDADDFAKAQAVPDEARAYLEGTQGQCHLCGVMFELGRRPFKTETCAGCRAKRAATSTAPVVVPGFSMGRWGAGKL